MDITIFIINTEAVLEFVFFLLTMYSLVVGLKTKNCNNLKKYGSIYLVLNVIRNVYTYTTKKAMAVSMIGGADGPTSIFLAGRVGGTSSMLIYLLSLLIIFLGIGIVIYIRKKK